MTRLSRLTSCDGALVRRSRYGDRRATSQLAARHLERIALLAAVVGTTPEQSAELARQGFALALQSRAPFSDALIEAFGQLAADAPDADQARARLLVELVDLEHRPVAEAAALLGLAPPVDEQLLSIGRAGMAFRGSACRGWGLASGRGGLTDAEQQAGVAHLALCRHCRDRLAARERARATLLARTSAVAALIGAGHLATLVGSAGSTGGMLVGKLALGKVATGVVGAMGAAVLATGGVAAVAQQRPPDPAVPHHTVTQTVPPAAHPPTPATSPAAACSPTCPKPAGPPALVHVPDAPLPTAVPTLPGVAQLPLPTLPALPLPTVSLPPLLRLPLPLPSVSLPPIPLPPLP